MPIVQMARMSCEEPRSRRRITTCSTSATSAVKATPASTAGQKPRLPCARAMKYAPTSTSEPWAKFTTRVDLKMITKPRAISA